jgi:hypothetical protein
MFTRLPRFERAAEKVHPIQITSRDEEVIRLVAKHRFLRSTHLHTLIGGSYQQLLRRLQLLFHHGYLDRPRAQISYFYSAGSQPVIYSLGRKGRALLEQVQADTSTTTTVNPFVQQLHLEHTLLTAEFMVALERSCRAHNISLTQPGNGNTLPCRWTVNLNGKRLGVVPDAAFLLGNLNREPDHAYFLEADRGTMPVTRKGMNQTSFYRKLLAYESTWRQNTQRTTFGIRRFRVLTVTTSPARLRRMIEAGQELERGRGLFLFTDVNSLRAHGDVLTLPWQSVHDGRKEPLLATQGASLL